MRKSRRLLILGFIWITASAALVLLYRNIISVTLSPKAALSSALRTAGKQIEERFADSTALPLISVYNGNNNYIADVQLIASNRQDEKISCIGNIQIDNYHKQICADGKVVSSRHEVGGTIYADREYIAFSPQMTNPSFRGITFDSFSKDIRSIPFVKLFIDEQTLSYWDDLILSIQKVLDKERNLSQVPMLSEEDLQILVLGMLALPCDTTRCAVSMQGEVFDCREISYSLSPDKVNSFFSFPVIVKFYLHETNLIKIQLQEHSVDKSHTYTIELGKNPYQNDIRIYFLENNNNSDCCISIIIHKNQQDGYIETLEISNGPNQIYQISVNNRSGEVSISSSKSNIPIRFFISESENGAQIQSSDYKDILLELWPELTSYLEGYTITGTFTLSKGTQIEKPAYKNIDQWSAEDFMTLIQNFGIPARE